MFINTFSESDLTAAVDQISAQTELLLKDSDAVTPDVLLKQEQEGRGDALNLSLRSESRSLTGGAETQSRRYRVQAASSELQEKIWRENEAGVFVYFKMKLQ